MNLKQKTKTQAGFSLLEILIAAVIGMLLIGVILQNYLSVKKIYKIQNEIMELSDNIRFADFFLRQNIMHAGFVGCRKISELAVVNHTDMDFVWSNVIYGYDSTTIPAYLSDKKIVFGTDVIVITKANADITSLITKAEVGSTSFKVVQNPATSANQFLLISDCKNADLFVSKNYRGTTINSKSELKNRYQTQNSFVSRVEKS